MERTLTLRYATGLALVALLAALAFWNIHSLSALHRESAYFIDLAANQAALAQRLAAGAARLDLLESREQRALLAASLRQDAEIMGNNHRMLTGEASRLPDYYRYSQELRAVYFNPPLLLDQQVQRYLQQVAELLAEPEAAKRAFIRDSLLLAARERLPDALRQAARLFRDEARSRADVLRLLGLGILALTLGQLAVDATLIFRPLLRRVTRAGKDLDEMARKMEEAACTDRLTCLPNRARMNEVLDRELSAARRYGSPLSLLLLDIDRFGEVNTALGQETGDRLLAEVALLIRNNLRLTDHAFRYDGEAFAVLATQTTAEGALALGEKLRRLIRSYGFGSEPLTVCLGVTTWSGVDDRERLLQRAESALRRAKNNGRDRLELEPAPA